MDGLLLGLALGAMAFTEQGREIGNKLGEAAMKKARKVLDGGKKSAEQSPGTSGDPGDPG